MCAFTESNAALFELFEYGRKSFSFPGRFERYLKGYSSEWEVHNIKMLLTYTASVYIIDWLCIVIVHNNR